MEAEGPIGQAYTTDDAVTILDLRYPDSAQDGQPLNLDGSLNRRKMSGSSLTAMSDLPSYEDFSAALSEAPSYGSDYPATSNRNSIMSSIQMSPVASPRMTTHNRSEQVRAHSRGRATPSPRPSMRSVPYSIEGSKNQRWSTGSYATAQGRRQSPFVYNNGSPEVYGAPQRMSYQGPPPANFSSQQQPMGMGAFPTGPRASFMMAGQPVYQRNSMLLPSQLPSQHYHHDASHYEQPPPLPSQGLFKMLQSNGDVHALHGHYTDLADPPDLFAPLHEEQIPPPEEDMNPADPDLIPYEQDLRFEGDLYTPWWVRGHGNKREGWCGICKPGRWLVLKNSAFWYDKSFTHGISAATGAPFQEPLETRRMDGNPDVWEGMCGSCNDWVALVSSKKKGTTWFRHAYKVSQGGCAQPWADDTDVAATVPQPSQGQGWAQASPRGHSRPSRRGEEQASSRDTGNGEHVGTGTGPSAGRAHVDTDATLAPAAPEPQPRDSGLHPSAAPPGETEAAAAVSCCVGRRLGEHGLAKPCQARRRFCTDESRLF